MKPLRKLLEFYVNSNIHVSVAVFSLISVFGNIFKIDVFEKAFLLGNLTFCAYHFTRFTNKERYQGGHLLGNWYEKHKRILSVLLLIATVTSVYLFTRIHLSEFYTLLPFAFLTFFYGVPVVKWKGQWMSLRFIPGIKIFVIAIVWAGVVVNFGLLGLEMFVLERVVLFTLVLLFVLLLTIPFDIRDYHYDNKKLKTIPQVLGLRNAQWFSLCIALISILLSGEIFPSVHSVRVYFFIVLVLMLFVAMCKPTRPKYFTAFWVEGIPVFWYLLEVLV